MRTRWIALGLVAGLGCSGFGPDRDLAVVSSASSYVAGTSAMFTVTNRSNRTHSFTGCWPSGKVDRHTSTGWAEISGFGQFCIAIVGPVSLAPGQSHQFAVSLGHSSFIGTLRIRLTDGERILAFSNEFNVTN